MMSETALMVLELAGIALLIAGLPLAFLYFKKGMGLFQKLNWTIVFLTFDLILFGAFTQRHRAARLIHNQLNKTSLKPVFTLNIEPLVLGKFCSVGCG